MAAMSVSAANEILADLGVTEAALPEVVGDALLEALASPLAVSDCAVASVTACLAAAADLARTRSARRPVMAVDTGHIAAAVRSETWLRDPGGRALSGFASLSRLWPTADGWVRTHANYPWHRAALLDGLEVPDGADIDVEAPLAQAIAQRRSVDVETCVYGAGGLAVAARTIAEWQATGRPGPWPRTA